MLTKSHVDIDCTGPLVASTVAAESSAIPLDSRCLGSKVRSCMRHLVRRASCGLRLNTGKD